MKAGTWGWGGLFLRFFLLLLEKAGEASLKLY